MIKIFRDRTEAGQLLAKKLAHFAGKQDAIVLALPRGGVPVGYEIAEALNLPLDIFLVRKLGVPGHEELAFGAIAMGNVTVFNQEIIAMLGLSQFTIDTVIAREQMVLNERDEKYRGNRPLPDLNNRTVILVDDGIATGATLHAAIKAIRQLNCRYLVAAVPVAPTEAISRFSGLVDEIVCLETPADFFAIGSWYEDFSQTTDEEVYRLLGKKNEWGEPTAIPAGEVILAGNLQLPENSRGLVLFVHGSGSSRLSPRNNYVARSLNQLGLATLLFDLLTAEEDKIDEFTREYRFDIPLLARRLNQVTAWVGLQPGLKNLALGYFGASTGAAAALIAAAENKEVKAVVSRGGRPDLAEQALSQVEAATLLIVGEQDPVVIDLNRQAQARLSCVNQLVIVPGATHLFEEPGALDQVNALAGEWFLQQISGGQDEANLLG